MQTTVPTFAEAKLGLDGATLGTLYVLDPLVVVLFQLPVVERVRGGRRTRRLALSAEFWGVSFLALLVVYRVSLVGIVCIGALLILRTVDELLHAPLVTSLASNVGAAATRGSQLSTIEVAKRVGFAVSPALGRIFFDVGRVRLLWVGSFVACGALALGVLMLERQVTPAENGASTAD